MLTTMLALDGLDVFDQTHLKYYEHLQAPSISDDVSRTAAVLRLGENVSLHIVASAHCALHCHSRVPRHF